MVEELTWDPKSSSASLNLTKGSAMVAGQVTSTFCTAITEQSFKHGKHYWEIKMDNNSMNELKAGVTTSLAFDKNKAFSDFAHGYAFYGIGQLRNGSDSSGGKYARRWNK